MSVSLPSDDDQSAISYFVNGKWSDWQLMTVENEQDPLLRESNLVMFPEPVGKIRVRRNDDDIELHPIHVSQKPVSHLEAATRTFNGRPRILTRRDWGADESLLVSKETSNRSNNDNESIGDGGAAPSNRVRDCQDAQKNYPQEFKVDRTVTENAAGEKLRWPQQYSKEIKMLVVHHTAQNLESDIRSGEERMRALYQYHTVNRGWGDIGYHYIIDEKGMIYQGRAGGELVVGGHAYCNNIGSIGVALMGNFDLSAPPQSQMDSLQWLLDTLGKQYDIDLEGTIQFHGDNVSPIAMHRELVSTDCPGYYVASVMNQVRLNVATGNVFASIRFPAKSEYTLYIDRSKDRRSRRLGLESSSSAASSATSTPARIDGLFAAAGTELSGRPGEEQLFSMRFVAGDKRVTAGTSIAKVLSVSKIALWQESPVRGFDRVTNAVVLPTDVNAGESATIRFKVQFPSTGGEQRVTLGDVAYTIASTGRRARGPTTPSTYQVYSAPAATYARQQRLENAGNASSVASASASSVSSRRSILIGSVLTPASSSSSSSVSRAPRTSPTPRTTTPLHGAATNLIRIRLSYGLDTVSTAESATIDAGVDAIINQTRTNGSPIALTKRGEECVASQGSEIAAGIVRIDPRGNIQTIKSWKRTLNQFRGIIECRVIDGKLVLINELPLEDYMAGLAEEDDSQPFEKQRAFAIAARSYAAYYLDSSHRKFPGKPYDGSDSPAEFQSYGGYVFEQKNVGWVKSVRDTAGKVIYRNGEVVRAPYFSADDGRTRSPEERGWGNFPHADIFASKPDPWCTGMELRGHGVGMSGCGALGQANEGKSAEQILGYYYPGTSIELLH